MAKLSDDERKLLEELTARANAPDADDTFEIEIYDTNAGKGARLPFTQGKKWLYDSFGIGDAPAATSDNGGTGGTDDAGGAGTGAEGGAGGRTGGGGSIFGRK